MSASASRSGSVARSFSTDPPAPDPAGSLRSSARTDSDASEPADESREAGGATGSVVVIGVAVVVGTAVGSGVTGAGAVRTLGSSAPFVVFFF